ncbi:MAG: hypothetical protein F9K32_04990 [Desulfobulbaceae bacterium]|nr:MAG: hypothetical protein F9K32_04990 [Desulfobulbaceae bacterium]
MRWKYIASGLAICLIAAVLWYSWGSGLLMKKKEPTSLVPRETLFFAEQRNIGTLIDGFNASRLGRSLTAIDIEKVAAGAGLDRVQTTRFQQVVESAKELGNNAVIRKFCDDSLAFAFFPGTTEAVISGQKHSLPMQVLLIARPKQRAELLEMMSSAFTGDVRQGAIPHGKSEITRFTSEGTTFFAALTDGYFLFAFDQATLKTSLDLSSQPQASLAGLQEFIELKGQYDRPDFFVFTSLQAITAELSKHRPQEWPEGNLAGLRCSVYGVWREERRFRDRSITLIDREKLSPANRRFLANPPQINSTLSLVPAGVQFYYWSNALAFRTILELLEEDGQAEASLYAETAASFKELTGHDLQQVLAGFADGLSLQVKRGGGNELIPLPSLTVFFPVKDKAIVEDAIATGMRSLGLATQEGQYRNRVYRSCNLGLPGGIELLYGFLEGQLFFGSDLKMLQEIVDAVEDQKGLRESPDFAAFAADFDKPSNAQVYVKVSEVAAGVRELAGWAGAMLALKDGELAAKSQILIDGLLNPLLEGINMISTIGTRTFLGQDRITMESVYEVAPEQQPAKEQ